ncbi:MAG: hypothetical protein JW739_05865 [Opitutales bacterium]|nr:hypothetical protein [Opitutales bacterium]
MRGNKKSLALKGTIVGLCCLVSACTSVQQQKKLDVFNSLYATGQYMAAAQGEIAEIGTHQTDISYLLEHLQAGVALRYAEEYQMSNEYFDRCEDFIKVHDEDVFSSSASNVTAILVNDAVLDYRASEYDGIMVNTYKALNFWQQGKKEDARIEFNRALDRQRRAKERFAAEIEKQNKAIQEKQAEENEHLSASGRSIDFDKSIKNPEIDTIISRNYSNLSEYRKYPDFVNPFTTYMAGLFFMSEGDYSKATDLLKESYGMVDTNSTLKNDFYSVEKRKFKKSVWVVFENGLGPVKEEFRVDLPIFLLTDQAYWTSFAFPRLELRSQAYSYLDVRKNGELLGRTEEVASMDRIVQTEFEKRFPMILTRAIVSTVVKTYLQHEAQKSMGDWGGIAAAIYQGATTSADVRIWTGLPKDFQVTKVPMPEDGVLELETPSGVQSVINLEGVESAIIYVKAPKPGVALDYSIIKF